MVTCIGHCRADAGYDVARLCDGGGKLRGRKKPRLLNYDFGMNRGGGHPITICHAYRANWISDENLSVADRFVPEYRVTRLPELTR